MNLDVPSPRTPSYQRAISKAKSTRAARKIVLLGSERCGKTSLVQRFLTNDYTEGYVPTVEDCYEINYNYRCFGRNHNRHHNHNHQISYKDKKVKKPCNGESTLGNSNKCYTVNLDIIDMCAPFTFPVMRELNVNTASVVLILYQVGDIASVQEAIAAFKTVDTARNLNQSVVLVGTKYDLYPHDIQQDEYEQRDELFNMLPSVNAGHVLTSAKLNFGVKEVFDQGLEWHVNNKHSTSMIDDEDIKVFKSSKSKYKRCCFL